MMCYIALEDKYHADLIAKESSKISSTIHGIILYGKGSLQKKMKIIL